MNIVRYSIASSLLLAFAAIGCAGADESGQFEGEAFEKGEEGADQDSNFDFAPEAETITDKAAYEAELAAKGSSTVTLGSTFYSAVTIGINQTVTYTTSNRVGNTDPVLVLFQRTTPWNQNKFGGSPFTERPGVATLAVDDDSAGNLNSTITWHNNTGVVINAFLMAFAYGNNTGSADINGFGTVQIRAGSVKTSGTQGWAGTSASTGDPWLCAFDIAPNSGSGAWNDDSPLGGTESRINNFTSNTMWYVGHAWSGSGTTTISY
jgi:hypothetical protein